MTLPRLHWSINALCAVMSAVVAAGCFHDGAYYAAAFNVFSVAVNSFIALVGPMGRS